MNVEEPFGDVNDAIGVDTEKVGIDGGMVNLWMRPERPAKIRQLRFVKAQLNPGYDGRCRGFLLCQALASTRNFMPQVSMRNDSVAASSSRWLLSNLTFEMPG